MNTRYAFLLFCAAFFSLTAAAQTVKFKGKTVLVDGKEFAYITDETPVQFTLASIESDSELVYVKLVDPTPGALSDFDDRYYLVRFPDFDREAILRDSRKTSVIKWLASHGLIDDGHINKLNFESFIAKYGTVEDK